MSSFKEACEECWNRLRYDGGKSSPEEYHIVVSAVDTSRYSKLTSHPDHAIYFVVVVVDGYWDMYNDGLFVAQCTVVNNRKVVIFEKCVNASIRRELLNQLRQKD